MDEEALALSEKLARTLDEEPEPVRIGDLTVDAKTGEILDWPEDVNIDRFEWLTWKAVEAERNIDGWKQALALYKQALGKLLDEAGTKALPTVYGTVRWKQRDNSEAPVERVPELAKTHELSTDALLLLYGCASRLSVSRLRALRGIDASLAPAIGELIEEKQSKPWVQIDNPRGAAPDIERGKEGAKA